MEGYRWRDERVWEKCAVLISYVLQPWAKSPITPKNILDALHGPAVLDLDTVLGLNDPAADFDASLAEQERRRLSTSNK